MKVFSSIWIGSILVLSLTTGTIAADYQRAPIVISQNSIDIDDETTIDTDVEQSSATTISLNRADLRQPHILQVYGTLENTRVPIQRVEVRMNGKVIKTIANGSLKMNLAPLMQVGRYQLKISGFVTKPNTAISLNFTSANVNVNQQSSGTGKIDRELIIDVR